MLSHTTALLLLLVLTAFTLADSGPFTLKASNTASAFDGWNVYLYFQYTGDTQGAFWLTNDTKTVPTNFYLSDSNLIAQASDKNHTSLLASIQPSAIDIDNAIWFFSQAAMAVHDATLLECSVVEKEVECQVTDANSTVLKKVYACPKRWHGQNRADLRIGSGVDVGCEAVKLVVGSL